LTQKTNKKPALSPPEKAGFFRYISAIFYDSLLIIALFFLATAVLLPFTNGEAVHSPVVYPLYLLSVSFVFLAWFWIHGGQTLGMRAWNLYLISDNNKPITTYQALTRFFTAIFSWSALGLGILWQLWHKDGKTWQDLNSKSSIVYRAKQKKK